MKRILKAAVISAAVAAAPMAVMAGSTIGGQPGNGGGTTFGISEVLGGQAVADAIASGDPAAINTAILNSIALNFPSGVDLAPFPNQTGAETVAILTSLIQNFAAAVGLPLNSPAIQALLQIAQTAIA